MSCGWRTQAADVVVFSSSHHARRAVICNFLCTIAPNPIIPRAPVILRVWHSCAHRAKARLVSCREFLVVLFCLQWRTIPKLLSIENSVPLSRITLVHPRIPLLAGVVSLVPIFRLGLFRSHALASGHNEVAHGIHVVPLFHYFSVLVTSVRSEFRVEVAERAERLELAGLHELIAFVKTIIRLS